MTEPKDWRQDTLFDDPVLKMDFSSEAFGGATNAVAALGNGRLTAGVSPWGELTYFRWPTPSHYDHLRYMTTSDGLKGVFFPRDMRHGPDSPSRDWRRYGRPYEVHPGLGARAGVFSAASGLNWCGDATWESARAYVPDDGPVLCTRLTNPWHRVEIAQWIDPEDDLLVQEFVIRSPSAQGFFYTATFAPSRTCDPYMGVPDSKRAGFAAVYMEDCGLILYFLPEKRAASRLKTAPLPLTPAAVDALYPEGGIFIAMGLPSHPDGFQIGADRRGRRASRAAPPGASEDAGDGALRGDPAHIGSVDAGLAATITAGETRLPVFIAVAASAQGAAAIIAKARAGSLEELKGKAVRHTQALIRRIDLPAQAGPSEKRVATRALMNLFIGRDRNSGAMIASPSRQPHYHFDWPRDGAFFDLALDLAGFPETASAHLDFYRRHQRRSRWAFSPTWLLGLKSPFYSPRGHWHANHYTDGRRGGLATLPMEIDETALVLWDVWRHEQYCPPAERPAYQGRFREMIALAAMAVAAHVNRRQGWVRRTIEDDNQYPCATLHGAAAVLAGLCAAADAGRRWGMEPRLVADWEKAARSLHQGILRRVEDRRAVEEAGWRGIQWALFPAPVFGDLADPRAHTLIARLQADLEAKVQHRRLGYAYLAEQAFILGIAGMRHPELRPVVKRALDEITEVIPMPGTDCYGEITLWISMSDGRDLLPQQRTSIPHLWTGICAYLAVEAYHRPERFLAQIPPCPRGT